MTNVDEYQTGREVYLFDVLRAKAEIAQAKAENREPDLNFPRGISDPLEFARVNRERINAKVEEDEQITEQVEETKPEEPQQEPETEDESDEEPEGGVTVAPGVVIS